MVQITNCRVRDAHSHRVAAACVGRLWNQERRESMRVTRATAVQSLKLHPLLSGACDVEIKLTVADYDCAPGRLLLGSNSLCKIPIALPLIRRPIIPAPKAERRGLKDTIHRSKRGVRRNRSVDARRPHAGLHLMQLEAAKILNHGRTAAEEVVDPLISRRDVRPVTLSRSMDYSMVAAGSAFARGALPRTAGSFAGPNRLFAAMLHDAGDAAKADSRERGWPWRPWRPS